MPETGPSLPSSDRGSQLRVAVIGGGIAGVSVAYAFARRDPAIAVTVLEQEPMLARHSTGRSAAQFVINYGALAVRPLTALGRPFLEEPPAEMAEGSLLSPRPILFVAAPDHEATITEMLADTNGSGVDLEELGPSQAVEWFPALRADRVGRAVLEVGGQDIDVAGLHQAFVRGLRRAGGVIATTARVDAAHRSAPTEPWTLESTAGPFEADLVVNAAGAWGDVVANRAGVVPLGLVPKRRTAFMTAGSPASARWPFLADAANRYYVKPDGSQFLCSPADATPTEPGDAKPEQVDIAQAIDTINEHTTLGLRSVRSAWAGLRTFVSDESLVLGPDDQHPDFLWCVGQGGVGIQTARAAGQLVVDLALDGRPGPMFDGVPLDLTGLTVGRLRTAENLTPPPAENLMP
jgi:D-arginine dehydrogenase